MFFQFLSTSALSNFCNSWYSPAMLTIERITSERHFHDAQARERTSRFADRESLAFEDSRYLDHEPWIRYAFSQLGELSGKSVLDYGCGHGMATVALARRGAIVSGFDLSVSYVEEARNRTIANGVSADLAAADAHELPYENGTFDAVWGNAILHHLDLRRAAIELRRTMKPGAVAVFCEPWGGNPAFEFGRKFLPYPGKDRTPDERPLRQRDLVVLREVFAIVECRGFQLLGCLRRMWKRESPTGGLLDRIDDRLFRTMPFLEKLGRYMVLTMKV
jgi:2-polyprenyl-3-methyl-5-hydroxy-6-metoxy-1,4-benzoquinol methylase